MIIAISAQRKVLKVFFLFFFKRVWGGSGRDRGGRKGISSYNNLPLTERHGYFCFYYLCLTKVGYLPYSAGGRVFLSASTSRESHFMDTLLLICPRPLCIGRHLSAKQGGAKSTKINTLIYCKSTFTLFLLH